MKASEHGTPLEQLRHTNGWMGPRQANTARMRDGTLGMHQGCFSCRHSELRRGLTNPSCNAMGGRATLWLAFCEQWEARDA